MDAPATCNFPDCDQSITPGQFSCNEHWRVLPSRIQQQLWKYHRTNDPEREDAEYQAIMAEVQVFAELHADARKVRLR